MNTVRSGDDVTCCVCRHTFLATRDGQYTCIGECTRTARSPLYRRVSAVVHRRSMPPEVTARPNVERPLAPYQQA